MPKGQALTQVRQPTHLTLSTVTTPLAMSLLMAFFGQDFSHQGSFITLHACHSDKLGFLNEYFVVDPGTTGSKLAGVLERTGQFAGLAANTFCGIDAYQFLHELPPSRDEL
jgi:hypothetical protein